MDNENQEPLIRVLGGLIGVAIAFSYNKVLVATRDNKEDEGYYYRMVWGREPVPDDVVVAPAYSADRKYTKNAPARYMKEPTASGKSGDCGYYGDNSCDVRTICVSRCKIHPTGVGCSAECIKSQICTSMDNESNGGKAFKLRIPYVLDHPK